MKRLAYYLSAAAVLAVAACSSTPASTTRPATPSSRTSAPVANGVDKMTASQATRAAITALSAAGTVHVRGTYSADGKPATLDMHLSGTGLSGTMAVQGATAQIILISPGKDFFMEGSAGFWKVVAGAPEAAAQLLADRWIKVPPDAAGNSSPPTLQGLIKDMTQAVPQSQLVARATLNGRDVALITYSDGSLLYVSLTGRPYPLRYVKAGTDGGRMDFSDFGAPVTLTPPKGAIDFTSIGG